MEDIIFLTGEVGNKKIVELVKKLGWSRMFTTRVYPPFKGEKWGVDNGAFGDWRKGRAFNHDRFMRHLEKALNNAEKYHYPYLAVLPDIVGGGLKSLELSISYLEKDLPDFNWYLALQDGMKIEDIETVIKKYKKIKGLFLGGTDKFKSTAPLWSRLAKQYGLKFHYGRAGTPQKLAKAIISGADSADSAFPLWVRERLEYLTKGTQKHLDFLKSQKKLWEV